MKKIFATVCILLSGIVGTYADNISAEDVSMEPGETAMVSISLTNTTNTLVGFQMDLTLPEGIGINKAGCQLSSRFGDPDQALTIGKQGDNVYRLTSTSFALTPISGTSGTIIMLSLTASATSQGGTATLGNILFATSASGSVTMSTATFNITVQPPQVEQTLALESLPAMTYGDAAYTLPATTAEGLTLTWTSGNIAVATISGNTLTVGNAGTATITATQAGNDSYLPFSREFSLTVGKAVLTITANDCTKMEGEENPELTVSYEGFKNGDTEAVLTQQPTVTTTATTSSPVGTYPITASGAQAANYDITYVAGTLTVWDRSISFADEMVKAICVQNWDTDGNGELSEAEAAAVTSLGGAFYGNTTIKSFDELQYFTGLTSIGPSEFNSCSGLTSITIPNSVTSIGQLAFNGCSSLTSITIPNSVTSIGLEMLSGCTDLTSIVVENGNTVYDSRNNCNAIIETSANTLIQGCKNTTIPNSVTSIGSTAFLKCYGLTSITIPNSVTSIGQWAFDKCSSLTSVTFHCKNVSNAFHDNTSIREVSFGEEVETIANNAFSNCSGLTSLIIYNNGRISIGQNAFSGCSSLTSAIYHCKNVSKVLSTSIKEVILGDEVESIGDNAFSGCNNLTSITIPNSVTSIGDMAFSSCSRFTAVHISDLASWCNMSFDTEASNPLYYAHHLFLNGEEVMDLVIPNSSTTISSYAFSGCTGITSVTIPNSVTTIGKGAFSGCTGITSVTIPNSVTSIGISAFQLCKGLTSVTIPNSVTSISDYAFSGCSGLTSVSIPNSVTSIGNAAFGYCRNLTEVTIPNSVTSIGGSAFYNCSGLTSVTIPNSVTTIGYEAFSSCSGLTSVHISELDAWCNISFGSSGANPLYYAHHLYLNGAEVIDLVIPNSVTSISGYAFSGCSGLTSVTIPNSVTSIGSDAFRWCNGLTSVKVGMETPLSISSSTFSNRANAILYVPRGSKAAYEAADYWKEFKEIVEYGGIEQTLALETLPSMTYGDDAYTLPETTAEGLTLTWTIDNTAVATVSGNVLAINGAGTAAITATQAGNDSYLPFSREFSLTVGKAALTITANDCSKVEGEENPELTVSYEGFVNDDDASVLTQQPTVTTEATTDSPAGTYPITASGAEAANYDISYVAGTLTVEEAKIEPTDISLLDNAIYVDPVETASNSTYALNIKAKNNVTVAGMSFTLTLPDDFSLITDDGGIINTLDSQRASSSKFMVMSSQSGNSYLIRVLPISGTTISGTDGTVLTVRLKNTNAEEGTYELKVNNCSFTVKNADNTFETLPLVDVISTIEITGNLLGDVNGDGNVDLTDAIMIVNHSLDNTPSNFRIDVADVNGDGNIDLTDAIIVVNMSMDSSSMAHQAFMMDLDPE